MDVEAQCIAPCDEDRLLKRTHSLRPYIMILFLFLKFPANLLDYTSNGCIWF